MIRVKLFLQKEQIQMIEQTSLNGKLYLSYISNNTLVSKHIQRAHIQFGPPQPITIFKVQKKVYVQYEHTKQLYLYENEQQQDIITPPSLQSGYFYYYGIASYTDKDGHKQQFPYFIQNKPQVMIHEIPDMKTFELPRTLQSLDYDITFIYPNELYNLIGDYQATYVDKYKRPIRCQHGRLYPISIDKVTTTFNMLQPSTYPVVVNLTNTPFAVVDLEPGYTDDDLAHFQSLQGYYKEKTPRGGQHLIVPLTSDTFKFRYSDKLEVINNSMITFYGINGEWLQDNPAPLDISKYNVTNHTTYDKIDTHIPQNIQVYVDRIIQKSKQTFSTAHVLAKQKYEQDNDISHGEYLALFILYQRDIKPYISQFPSQEVPWILAAYATKIIPWREKHETMRNGVPYLTYLAHRIIHYQKQED